MFRRKSEAASRQVRTSDWTTPVTSTVVVAEVAASENGQWAAA